MTINLTQHFVSIVALNQLELFHKKTSGIAYVVTHLGVRSS